MQIIFKNELNTEVLDLVFYQKIMERILKLQEQEKTQNEIVACPCL